MSKAKINYKSLNKKRKVSDIMSNHSPGLCVFLACVLIFAPLFGTTWIISKVGNMSFCAAIGHVIGAIIGVGVLYLLFDIIVCVYTYIRMLFRYAYFPLSEEEAKTLHIDTDPVTYFKALKQMMCYKMDFKDTKSIYEIESDDALSRLFYSLFFSGDDALIMEWLTDENKMKQLYDAMTVKRRDSIDKDDSLLDCLEAFYTLLSHLIESKEIVTKIVYLNDSALFETNDDEVVMVHAIVRTDKYAYILDIGDKPCSRCVSDLAIAFAEKYC